MKKLILIFTILLSQNLLADTNSLRDVNYNFDATKLDVAKDSFHFLRSFVDYYYLLVKENRDQLPEINSKWSVSGWCAGDAHPENFGILIGENGTRKFTINDWDDSGPCPVFLDIVRLMVSSKLYNSQIKVSDLMDAYQKGFEGQPMIMSDVLSKMMNESQIKGEQPSPKKVMNNRFVRNDQSVEVDANTKNEIEKVLNQNIMDIMQTAKVGGGSGGLKRFEVLTNNQNNLVHLEMKNEIDPAIYSVETENISNADRFQKSFEVFVGNDLSRYYSFVNFENEGFLVRPRFYGNIGVSLTPGVDLKPQDIIPYEAYTLGKLHAQTVSTKYFQSIDKEKLKIEVEAIANFFQAKFNQLKNNN